MKIKKQGLWALALAYLLSACTGGQQSKQEISLSGAFALYPLVVKWSEEFQKTHPDVRFNISAGGAGKGMADALSQTVELGMFSREISQVEKEKGVWWMSVTKDAVIPTINKSNPVFGVLSKRGLTRDEFRAIYITGQIVNWQDLDGIATDAGINVYTRSDACGAAGTWADYLGGKQEDLNGIGVFGDPGLADAVVKDVNGVGFNNTIYLYNQKTGQKNEGIEVIPIDVNENGLVDPDESFYDNFPEVLTAIADGRFPSPPARELYLVAKGKPEKQIVLDFLRWVVTDGQRFVSEAGYVPLTEEKLKQELDKLNE